MHNEFMSPSTSNGGISTSINPGPKSNNLSNHNFQGDAYSIDTQ